MNSTILLPNRARRLLSFLLVSILIVGIAVTFSNSSVAENGDSSWGGVAHDNGIEVSGHLSNQTQVSPGATGTRPKDSIVDTVGNTGAPAASESAGGTEETYTWRHLCADNSSGNISIACAVAAPDVCPPGEYYGAILSIDAVGFASETGSYGCTGGATAAAAPAGGNEGATGTTAPTVVIVVTAADFQRLAIPPSTIKLDTGGNTLRTAHTNIYANAGVKMLNTTVLGQPVRVRAIPIEYIWDYGDGTTRRTWKPGEAIGGDPFDVETETSHQFEETGSFPINLTTVYTGQFSVNGGPWIPIDGVARVSSAPESMEVWKTKRYLVAENCIANPGAIGCTDG